MSVTTETNRTAELVTDGAETDFDFSLLIYNSSEIEVWYKATGGSYVQLTLNTDYGVVFTSSGGTVSTDGYTAPLAAGVLLIIRHLELTQQTNWLYNDNHTEQTHQDDFDRSSMRDIQQQEELDRCPKFLTHSDTIGIDFPEPTANELVGWNAGGTNLANISISGVATLVAALIGDLSAQVPEYLTDLTDATITSPAAGQIFYYNGSLWLNSATPTLTSITIGANTLNTNEWAYLDGQDQALKKADAPQFATGVKIGNLTFADGSITDSGGTIDFDNEILTGSRLELSWYLKTSFLHVLDSVGETYFLQFRPGGTQLTADRLLTIDVGNAARTLTLSGNPTLGDWFDHAVKTTSAVQHASLIIDGTIEADTSITGDSFVTAGNIGVAGDVNLLQLAANALTINGTVRSTNFTTAANLLLVPSTDEIQFRDSDVSMGSTLADGTLDISADVGVRMFYDNADVGDATAGQIFNIFRRAAEGDEAIALYVDADNVGNIGLASDTDLLQLAANTLTVNGSIALGNVIYGTGDTDTSISLAIADTMIFRAGNLEFFRLSEVDKGNDEFVGNEGGVDIDFRWEGVGQANALFVQGSDGTVGIQNALPTLPFDVKAKSGMTSIGGFAVKLTNKTGANTIAGTVVKADVATDDAFILCAADDDECFGVVLDGGVADSSEAWVVVAGIADVAMKDNTAATHGNWVEVSDDAGYADATSATPAAAPTHFLEIGHCIESVAAGGGGTHILARCILHFN